MLLKVKSFGENLDKDGFSLSVKYFKFLFASINDFVSKAIVSLESYNIPIDLETVTACLFKSANIC